MTRIIIIKPTDLEKNKNILFTTDKDFDSYVKVLPISLLKILEAELEEPRNICKND